MTTELSNKQKAAKIRKLNAAYNRAYNKMQSKLGDLIKGLEEVTGKEIQYNHFAGDGLGVVVGESYVNNYMGIEDAIGLIENKGTIDEDDFTYL